jgi:hypothetical protein
MKRSLRDPSFRRRAHVRAKQLYNVSKIALCATVGQEPEIEAMLG